MTGVLSIVAGVCVATGFGAMVFFSSVMAPLIFTRLPEETAGRFIRQVFPWYYAVLAVVTGVGALVLLASTDDRFDGIVCAAIAAGFVLARQWLMPRINALRDRELAGDAAAAQPFQAAHRASVVLNFVQLVGLGFVLVRMLD
ncbi:MAG: DUF4149 domain-containing protein [Myxococcota bacterium]